MAESHRAPAEFRLELEELQERWSSEDARDKISNRVTDRLAQLYRDVDEDRRAIFDAALADWVLSPNPGKRFDGAVLTLRFRVVSALPAVRRALASWTAVLLRHSDMHRDGDYAHVRSQALSAVDQLGRVARVLEADGDGAEVPRAPRVSN